VKTVRAFIYGHSSTKPANSVKIGQVDVQKIGLSEIAKKEETSAEHRPIFGLKPAG